MQTLFVNGSVGAGKTSTAEEIGRMLRARDIPHAVVDLDWLRFAWPAPKHDPFNNELELHNLADVTGNFREAGVERLVLAGVIEKRSMRARYETAVGGSMVVCRLSVKVPELLARLALRHENSSDLEWHLRRAGELDRLLAAERLDDFVIHVESDSVRVVAQRVVETIGWE